MDLLEYYLKDVLYFKRENILIRVRTYTRKTRLGIEVSRLLPSSLMSDSSITPYSQLFIIDPTLSVLCVLSC
jgi:hypothetical protein